MADELLDLLANAKKQALGGEHVRYIKVKADRPEVVKTEAFVRAVRDVTRLLANGQWHKKSLVRKITQNYKVNYDAVCQECGLAESDGGYYICMPSPEGAPDETPNG